nr:hypothetical protein [Tanacetum cinerariifolium]
MLLIDDDDPNAKRRKRWRWVSVVVELEQEYFQGVAVDCSCLNFECNKQNHTQDNILITQELLKGYNRKNGAKRCAMKIDIHKAYDTISWDFLIEVMLMVGFHDTMVHWIMTCITSASFSICINGDINRFFKGEGTQARRPYFAILIHPCDGDDLMVLCNGDIESLKVVKKSLDDFSDVSGLFPTLARQYWASVYMIPTSVTNELENIFKSFLWNSGGPTKGKANLAWKNVCRPKVQGGLGFKPMHKWNEVLLISQLWKLIDKKESLWVKWVSTVKLKGTSIWEAETDNNDSHG